MRHLVCAITLLCAHTPAWAQSDAATLRELLPTGRVAVEVMEMWSPPQLVELTQKLQRAIAADPAWWQEHLRKAAPGQPVAYDPRLGLTQDEYRAFIQLADSSRMRPARVDTVVIAATATGWRFDESSSIAAVRGIEIDTIARVVRTTAFGVLAAASPIVAKPTQKVTGAWGGPRWHVEEVDPVTVTGTSAHFAVGRHESGHTILYLDAKRASKGQLVAQESFFLRLLR